MNSADVFSYAISGAMGENQLRNYSNQLNLAHQNLSGASGWLRDQAAKTMDSFNSFVTSRVWELSSRLLKKSDGDFVGRYEIGYLGSMAGLQQADGFMRNYIMANPEVMQQYLDGELCGYDGQLHARNVGVGAENIYYRRAMNGVVDFKETEEGRRAYHTHYHEIGNDLSFRQRVDIQRTWSAASHHLANTEFDITSAAGKKRTSFLKDEPEEQQP